MIHNSFTGMYECADAYFWLDGERLLGDCGDLIEWRRPVTRFDRERYEHWKASWVPDGWEDMHVDDEPVARLDRRLRAAWRSYVWRRWDTPKRSWTLQLAREPGVYTVGVEVRPDVTHLYVTVRVGVLALTVGTEPRDS